MSWADTQTSLLVHVQESLDESRLLSCEYFVKLLHGTLSCDLFARTQIQFFYAVRYFSRPMAALAARIPDSASRQSLVQNLSEEHGLDDDHEIDANGLRSSKFEPDMAHDQTFLEFLHRLGVRRDEVLNSRPGSAVLAFNNGLWGVCASESIPFAFAALGAIEYAFADISALIGRRVVESGWITEGELIHYKLHAEIDKRHAGDFFQSIERDWRGDSHHRTEICSGIDLGIYMFRRLYEDMLIEAEVEE
ncbi:MAG: iron-containing redox enzyme family protein [Planctomyces sp.]|nr:iron-containing redox enzyme family protein [Planctomyces sp.]